MIGAAKLKAELASPQDHNYLLVHAARREDAYGPGIKCHAFRNYPNGGIAIHAAHGSRVYFRNVRLRPQQQIWGALCSLTLRCKSRQLSRAAICAVRIVHMPISCQTNVLWLLSGVALCPRGYATLLRYWKATHIRRHKPRDNDPPPVTHDILERLGHSYPSRWLQISHHTLIRMVTCGLANKERSNTPLYQ